MKRLAQLIFFLEVLAPVASAQVDSLVDVFPLEIGNSWIYRWETLTDVGGYQFVDTGSAQYIVTHKLVTRDSIVWKIHERRSLQRGNYGNYYPWDSYDDSSDFEIVETLAGRHQLIRVPGFDVYDPVGMFPFFRRYDLAILGLPDYPEDTTKIYRYWVTNPTSDSFYVHAYRGIPLSGGSTYWYWFTPNKGMLKIQEFGYAPGHHNWGATHVLRDAVITPRAPQIYLSQRSLVLLTPGANPTEVSLLITNSGNEVLKITGLTVDNTHFSASLRETVILPDSSATLRIQILPSDVGRQIAHVILVSNSASSPDTISVTAYTSNDPVDRVALYHNFPNPFNSQTTIGFTVPQPGFVSLRVFDLVGREVVRLVDEFLEQGTYERVFDASRFSSGVYVYQLRTGDFVQAEKMALIR